MFLVMRRQSALLARFLLTVVSGVLIAPGVTLADSAASVPVEIRYPELGSGADRRHDYYVAALKLALEKSEQRYGGYRLRPNTMDAPQERLLRLISTGESLDVMWSMTTRERETYLRPVRIPLLKGLMGYRVLIVRAEDREAFEAIRHKEQLAEKVAGQESDWPDTKILRANDLPVTTAAYEKLFTMLQHKRFDYFPRAINEPWSEIEQHSELDLIVDEHLLLHYPTAIYFFVHKDNAALAERLAFGLKAAQADGSFDRLFYKHPENAKAFSASDLLSRRILSLKNPLLPDATPLDNPDLWWHPDINQAKRQKSGN